MVPRSSAGRDRIRVIAAFAAIYFLWGGTFLAIRIAVLQIPPFLTAGLRFCVAGTLLHGYMRLRGVAAPTARQWRNLGVIGFSMFVATYGPLFWAEQFVSSSITSVIEATLPLTTIVFEVFIFRRQPFRWRLACSVAVGFCGVALLLLNNHEPYAPLVPCLVVLAAGVAWSLGAVLTGHLDLPESKPLTAGTAMMLGGAVLLVLSAATGEWWPAPHFSRSSVISLTYLIVAGSLIAYTAYVWLLARMSATRVASHAYVNPLVAIALGFFVADEPISARTLAAATLIIGSVYLILSTHEPPRQLEMTVSEGRA